jgi:hypothetical protein
MSRSKSNAILSVVHHNCCGLDIHKDKISAALVITEDDGGIVEEIREFGAFTDDLYKLKQWLIDAECHVVAMESTGVYWRPVHNIG